MQLLRNDIAAFRAFILLKQEAPEVYARIPAAASQKWAPVIVGLPRETGTAGQSAVADVLTDALAAAPTEFVESVRSIVRAERDRTVAEGAKADVAPGLQFFILRRLEGCWGCPALKEGVFQELKATDNSPEQFAALLDTLLAASFDPARDYAIGLLAEHDVPAGPYSLVAAEALARRCAAHIWPALWKLIVSDDTFARKLFLRLASHYRSDTPFSAGVGDTELAELFILLEGLFPRDDDPIHEAGEAHWVGPRESIRDIRDSVLRYLVGQGTVAAIQALHRIIAALPNLVWLPFELSRAEQVMRTKTWSPLTLKEVFFLTDRPSARLVTSADDLREVLVTALRKYEAELHGAQTPVRRLWDRQSGGNTFRPIEEDGLSDDVKLFLERELVTNAIIANREVEISRVPGRPVGQRTDIRINALRRSEDGATFDVITAVIEKLLEQGAFYGARSPALPRLHGAAAGARGYLPRWLVRQTEVGPNGRPPASDAELHLARSTGAT